MDIDENNPPISDIAPDGDVILVVGPEKTPLKVYSQCLRAASKVFRVMLGPDWSEGKGLTSQSPREIPLEEDDASALRTILCVLHHRNAEVPDSEGLSPTHILNIAVAADKYDLAVALKFAATEWLKPKQGLNLMDIGRLMTAALLLENAHMFDQQAMELILQCSGSYMGLLDDAMMSQFLPFKSVYLLEQRRSQMRAELGELIATNAVPMQQCPRGVRGCLWAKARNSTYRYATIRSTYTPAKLLNRTVMEVMRSIEDATFEDNLRVETDCETGSTVPRGKHKPLSHDQTVAGQFEAISQRARICIDCVRGVSPCKFDHGEATEG